MQSLPALSLLLSAFLGMPFPLTIYLYLSHDDRRSELSVPRGPGSICCRIATGALFHESVVWSAGKRQAYQILNRAKKAFHLARGQAKEQSEGERALDSSFEKDWLGNLLADHRRRPSVDRIAICLLYRHIRSPHDLITSLSLNTPKAIHGHCPRPRYPHGAPQTG